ncbi:Replication protein A DNA-binding subunit C [Glycine soja]
MCRLSLCWYSIFCKHNFLGFVFGGFHLFVDGYIAFAWFWIYHIFHLELEVLSNFMARIPNKIKSIDGSKETPKLAVRNTDLWFVGTPVKSEQAQMVFVDSEGDQIHDVCKADQLKSWKANLKENSTYVMHNFKVVKNDGQFRVCEHEYKLVFIGVTVVREADLHELPFKEFRFVEFGNVGNFVAGLLVDIIGVVDQVLFRHVSSKNTRVVFRMKDLSGEILSCTLWENYCMQFLSYLNERGNDGLIVIILTHARIKDVLLDLGVEVSPVLPPGDQESSQVSGGSQLSLKDAFLSKAKVKTISEINGISEDVVCVTVGTISKIVMDNHSWCYQACVQYILYLTGMYIARYRVEVMVTQNNESSKFLLWDHECAELNDQTADEVNRVKIEVRIQSKFRNVVVLRYSNELDLINVVLEMLADNHDPVAGFPLTPKKRISSDEVDDELGSSQISPAQLSSNKLTRHSNKSYNSLSYGQLKLGNYLLGTINMQRDLILQKPGSIGNVSCSKSDILMLSHLHNQQLTALPNMISHIVSTLTHMLDQQNSRAKSFKMARDRLADDQADNIKLQLIVARGKDGRINDDTLRNLTLIEIEQLLHINQRSLKDYPTMSYPQDINLTSYLQNNLMNEKQFTIELSKLSTTMKGQSLSMVGLYLPKPVFTHGQLYVALSRVNSAKGLKILIHDDKQKKIPPFYHQQWVPNYPESIQLGYNGATYQIQLQQHRGRYFLADGLVDFRADLKIYESIIINFFACDDDSIFYIHFTPPLDQQTCGRPLLHSRQHIWTKEIIQCILGAPHPLEIPLHARKHLKECGNHMTILRKHGPPLQ